MKAAKCLIICLMTLLIISFPFRTFSYGTEAAAANYKYARADARDIYFCERKDLKYALFTIPYTYCVEILSTDGEWYYVKYAEDSGLYRALYGYCLSTNLTPVEEPPENKYLNRTVTVTFKADTSVGSLPVLNELNVTAAFYGTYYAGASAYSYVLYDGGFGYVYGANDDYPLNETPSASTPEPEPPEQKEKDSKLLIAVALTALAAAALIILYFASRKSRYFRPDR